MARKAARVSVDRAGGIISSTPARTVYVNSRLAVAPQSKVSPHGKSRHKSATIVSGSSNVFVEGRPMSRTDDQASCGHRISTGSNNVFCN